MAEQLALLPYYTYDRLRAATGEFRLFELAPGSWESPIRGTLTRYRIGFVPTYRTVSYCWGALHERQKIEVDGHRLEVPLNAAMILCRMRRQERTEVVWIDSVCICQTDERERGQQVGMMCDIYSAADSNIVDLGVEDMSRALTNISDMNEEISSHTAHFTKLAETLRPSGNWNYSISPPTTLYAEKDLERFFDLPLFHRVWIVQEVTLAKRNICLCGAAEVDLLPVVRAGVWLEYKRHYIKSANLKRATNRIFGLFDLVDHEQGWYATHPHELHQLLRMSSNLQCTLAVDRVFGVLGLLQKYHAVHWQHMKADYAMPLEEVLELACKSSIMALRGSLYPIALVSHTRELAEQSETDRGLPSWVPDWTVSELHPLLATELGGPFNACDGRRRPCILDNPSISSRKTLAVRGMSVASVIAVGPIITSGMVSETSTLVSLSDLLEEWITLVSASHEDRYAALNCLPALLTAGSTDAKGYNQSTWTHSWAAFRRLLEDIASDTLDHYDLTRPLQLAVSLHPHIIDTCTNRRLCITSTGLVGIGPWLSLEDDIVAVLHGLSWPAFLRPSKGCHEKYQFLGVGYLHSIMDGSWARKQRAGGLRSRLFSLR